MRKQEYIIYGISFLVCFIIGFGGTTLIKTVFQEKIVQPVPPQPDTIPVPPQPDTIPVPPQPDTIPVLPNPDTIPEMEPKIKPMSAREFQRLLLSNDISILGGRNPRVALYVRIKVIAMRDGEQHPGDVQAVREKISYGIWKTARVVSVGHNAKGQIDVVTIQPIYPEVEEATDSNEE